MATMGSFIKQLMESLKAEPTVSPSPCSSTQTKGSGTCADSQINGQGHYLEHVQGAAWVLQFPQQPPELLGLSLHQLFSYLLSNLQKSACFAPRAHEALNTLKEFNASNKLIEKGICFLHVAYIHNGMPTCHDPAWL